MVLGGVARDQPDGHRVVKDQVREESPMLVAARGIARKSERLFREMDPEQLRSEWVILGVIGGGMDRAL
jgi:hypothetical protein